MCDVRQTPDDGKTRRFKTVGLEHSRQNNTRQKTTDGSLRSQVRQKARAVRSARLRFRTPFAFCGTHISVPERDASLASACGSRVRFGGRRTTTLEDSHEHEDTATARQRGGQHDD